MCRELEEATRRSLKERVLVLLGRREITDTLQFILVHVLGVLDGLSCADWPNGVLDDRSLRSSLIVIMLLTGTTIITLEK